MPPGTHSGLPQGCDVWLRSLLAPIGGLELTETLET